jgi:glycosyltransferase involved in cell wall biosynthesis
VKFTIVTPSLNQGRFIERTIESILAQRGDFDLEYLVEDGGSNDETLAILRRYEGRLRYASEPDHGQSDAINKGFRKATGDVLAWLNADDAYAPGALATVASTLRATGARWCFGQCRIVDERDREVRRAISWYKNRLSRRYSWRRLLTKDFIPQPATFFRRDLIDEVGRLDPAKHYAMDYDLWLRFARVAQPVFIPEDLASFRWHRSSKSGSRYVTAAIEALRSAREHARPEDRGALLHHYVHVVSLAAGYRLLDRAEDLGRLVRRSEADKYSG